MQKKVHSYTTGGVVGTDRKTGIIFNIPSTKENISTNWAFRYSKDEAFILFLKKVSEAKCISTRVDKVAYSGHV